MPFMTIAIRFTQMLMMKRSQRQRKKVCGAMAIQLIINRELGSAKNENPIQGSFLIEELTDCGRSCFTEFDRITERGGVLAQWKQCTSEKKSRKNQCITHTGRAARARKRGPPAPADVRALHAARRLTSARCGPVRCASRSSCGGRFNVAPGDDVLAVIRRGEDGAEAEGTYLRWGLVPFWAA